MKRKHRFLSVICAAILVFGLAAPCAPFSWAAADLTIEAGTVTSAQPGASIDVPVSIRNNPGINTVVHDKRMNEQIVNTTGRMYDILSPERG